MNNRFLTLAACTALLCAASVHAAENPAPNALNEVMMDATIKAAPTRTQDAGTLFKQSPELLVRAALRADLPGRTWMVTCSGVLTGTDTLLMDNPCTEILAAAYTEESPVAMTIDLSALGKFTKGEMKNRSFFYKGTPFPDNFQVREDGYAVFRIPAQNEELQAKLRAIPAQILPSKELTRLFLMTPRPTSFVQAPSGEKRVAYDPKDIAQFTAFLIQLDQDISNYVKYMAVSAEMTDCTSYTDELFQAKGFIATQGGLVMLRAAQPQAMLDIYTEIKDVKHAQIKNAKFCFYVNMENLGSYPDGKGFYANNTNIPLSQIYLTPGDTIAFTMQLPDGKPVSNALRGDSFEKAFSHRKINALWLQNFPPRIERAFAAME